MEGGDPYAEFDDELRELDKAISEFFDGLAAAIPAARVQAAVKVGSVNPIANSPVWALQVRLFMSKVMEVQQTLVSGGLDQGIAALPASAPALSARIGEIAEEWGGRRAIELAQSINLSTRDALRAVVGRAARDYADDQSLGTLRRLEAEIRSMIGLTPGQATRIEAWRKAAEATEMTPDQIAAGVEERADAATALRARAIADRAVIESISFGRHQAWVEARAAGDLPKTTKKRWQTQGDRRVRPTHRAQENAGPIPLDAPYMIMGVQHPPSHDFGCRCWEVLVVEDLPKVASA